jgi:hypothetical protein
VLSYSSTPGHIRRPSDEHAHLRLQVSVDGQSIDFSKEPYQHPYSDGYCSDEISEEPFHFHDHRDQMMHIHWEDMTGGELLKYYGWNLIGDQDDSLGYRFDKGLLKRQKVSIHGKNLPAPAEGSQYYVYIGDEKAHERKSWDDFLQQDLETFLDKRSNLPDSSEEAASSGFFFTKAYAHGEVKDGHKETPDKAQLERINNLLGNIVIFAGTSEPTGAQVQERFDNLLPLSESSCAG